MKKKSGGGEGGGANWMDTYGDMVTLLLCFFVLLYSMSTIDENKWKQVAMSFNPNAIPSKTDPVIGTDDGIFQDPNLEGEPGVNDPAEVDPSESAKEQEAIDQAMENLFEKIQQYINESGVNIEVTKGDGGVYLSMEDTIFFMPNESVMLPEGEVILKELAPILLKAAPYIDEIRVLGHTAQVNDGRENDVYFDWTLSASRAAVVAATLQELCPEDQLDPARLKAVGNGSFLPVAPNDNDANRRKNRRVEMVIKGKDLMDVMGDSIEQYYTQREDGPTKASTVNNSTSSESSGTESGGAENSSAADAGGESQEG